MSLYLDRENYFKTLAMDHVAIEHDQPIENEEDPRRSFFRINDEEELLAASQYWVHFPCLVMTGLLGSSINKDGSIRNSHSNSMLFLKKLSLDAAAPIKAAAITVVYDITFEVMQDFVARIRNDYEDWCGFALDDASFKWQQEGPIGDELYGWSLSFRDETKAPAYNPDKWGDNQPSTIILLADEQGNIITDEAGNPIEI